MFTMKIEGGAELAQAIDALPERVSRPIVREILRDVAEPMRARMGQLAPRRAPEPDLADNMVISTIGGGRNAVFARGGEQEVAVAIGPARGFAHGLLQEYGTAHHGAQPFARPAFDEEAPKIPAELARRLWVALAGRGIGRSRTQLGPVQSDGGGGVL